MNETIYLDNSATTVPSEASLQKMGEALRICFANPGSVHEAGLQAQELLEEARRQVASSLGVRRATEGQIIFTSGGTEANNLAILGSVFAKARPSRGKILITDGEHPSVAQVAAKLADEGFVVSCIPTVGGALDLDALEAAANGDVLLAAIMLVNNETGALYPIKEAVELLRRKSPGAVIHCDAVQGYLRTPFAVSSLGVDTLSVSAHKIHAPKGAGALYVSRNLLQRRRIAPILYGGGQEGGLRSGTENVPAIAAFGAAAAEGMAAAEERRAQVAHLREYLLARLPAAVQVNTPARHVDAIVSITLPDVKSEVMLRALSARKIYVSAGSACAARSGKVSSTLLAYGLSGRQADCTLRISLSHRNTEAELDRFAAALAEEIGRLARIR